MNLHLSFDFWNTLAVFNPDFSAERIACIARQMEVSEAEAREHYTHVKRFVDGEAERSGKSFASIDIYTMMLKRHIANPSITMARSLMEEIQELALVHPPIFEPQTLEQLARIRRIEGVTTSITSNTNFVTGMTLRHIMAKVGLDMEFCLFSDELPCAKPSRAIFKIIRQKVPRNHPIYHFGDHAVCDVRGARDAGMAGVLVDYGNMANILNSIATLK